MTFNWCSAAVLNGAQWCPCYQSQEELSFCSQLGASCSCEKTDMQSLAVTHSFKYPCMALATTLSSLPFSNLPHPLIPLLSSVATTLFTPPPSSFILRGSRFKPWVSRSMTLSTSSSRSCLTSSSERFGLVVPTKCPSTVPLFLSLHLMPTRYAENSSVRKTNAPWSPSIVSLPVNIVL